MAEEENKNQDTGSDDDLDVDESSLADFEEEFLNQEKKKKNTRTVVIFLVMLGVLGFGGYEAYRQGALDSFLPPAYKAKKEPTKQLAMPQTPEPVETVEVQDEFVDEMEPGNEFGEPAEEETVAQQKPKPKPKPKPEPEPKAKPAPKAPEKAEKKPEKTKQAKAADMGGSALQVGVFTGSAGKRVKELEAMGFSPVTEPATIYQWKLRVIAGYYPYRESAMEAAKDFINKGIASKVQIVAPGTYALEMGFFKTQKEAQKIVDKMEDKGLEARIDRKKEPVKATRVLLKGITNASQMKDIQKRLSDAGIDYMVVRK